jgi:hypothetical protein
MLRSCSALCLAVGLLWSGAAGAAPDRRADDEKTLHKAGVGTDSKALLDFFRSRTVRADQQQVRSLIRDLASRSFAARERASTGLTILGAPAIPQLRQALRSPDVEVRRRARNCLRDINNQAAPSLVAAAARRLAAHNPAGAAEALLDYLPAVLEDTTAEEVFQAIAAVSRRNGKPAPALLRAVTDKNPLRRAAAAVALSRGGPKDRQHALTLLRDADAAVRLHASLALVAVEQREAVPVLIQLFDTLPRAQLWPVEDILYRLAGERAPSVALGDATANRSFREAWLTWWRDHGAKVDLAALKRDDFRDHTLIVLLDEHSVLDLDTDDKVHFRINKLAFPLDVQALPGERVLLAEHGGNRVTERLRDGTVLWKLAADGPLVAQRLGNGHTFIATKDRLFEVDRAGKEVFSYRRPNGEQFMRARKLPDGTIACVTQGQLYVRLDPSGKELRRFTVQVSTFGGRLDVQPDGRVLIPEMYRHRVIEYDADGKPVRQFLVRQPIAATRLANGNTLITSMTENRAVEFDLAGKQVWQYTANTRVTRAYRR